MTQDSDLHTQFAEQAEGLKSQEMLLNMGPQHPSTHGVLRVVLDLDGERIVDARPDTGYLHTGIEQTIEDQQVEVLTRCFVETI